MDHRLTRCQQGAAGVVEPDARFGDVHRDSGDAGVANGLELIAPRFAEAVECVVAKDLAFDAMVGATPTRANEQHEFAVGYRAQEALDQSRAEESGRASDGDALAAERLRYHGRQIYRGGRVSTTW